MKRLLVISLLLNAALLGYGGWRLLDGAQPGAAPEADWLWTARVSLFETLPPIEGGDVFLGASIIQYGAWEEWSARDTDQPPPHAHNRGIRGDTTAGVAERLPASVKGHPDRVFVMVGLNDLMHGVPIGELVANQSEMLETLRTQSPGTQVLFFGLLPVRRPGPRGEDLNALILETNAALGQLARDEGCEWLGVHKEFTDETGQLRAELTTDGVHLNGPGYELLRDAVNRAPR